MSTAPKPAEETKGDEENLEKLHQELKENKTLIENIEESLECIVCNDGMQPPIKLCEKGHSFCGNCNLAICPLCRTSFTGARAFALEAIYELLRVKCEHIGCTEQLMRTQMKDHAISCNYRPMSCRVCNKEVEYLDYIYHLKLEHEVRPHHLIRRSNSLTATIINYLPEDILWKKCLIKHKPTHLVYLGDSYVIHQLFKDSNYYIFIHHAYPCEKPSKISVKVEINPKKYDPDEYRASCTVPVQNLRLDPKENMEIGKAAIFSFATMKNLWTHECGILKFEVHCSFSLERGHSPAL